MIGQGSIFYVLNQSDAKLKLIVAWSLFLSHKISFVRIFFKFSFRELIPVVSNILWTDLVTEFVTKKGLFFFLFFTWYHFQSTL